MTPTDIDQLLKPVLLKDLRTICRARGVSPAGGKEQLAERLKQYMLETGNYSMATDDGANIGVIDNSAGVATDDIVGGIAKNNYTRPEGQNVGNFITGRPSSRVLAAPGGGSSIVFGSDSAQSPARPIASASISAASPGQLTMDTIGGGNANNNYSRPGGQNVGNFLTERHAVKVAAPPGGASSIIFG